MDEPEPSVWRLVAPYTGAAGALWVVGVAAGVVPFTVPFWNLAMGLLASMGLGTVLSLLAQPRAHARVKGDESARHVRYLRLSGASLLVFVGGTMAAYVGVLP